MTTLGNHSHTRILAIDFETTGKVDNYPDEPWQLGLVSMENGKIQAENAREYYFHIGERPFNRYAPGRHAELRPLLRKSEAFTRSWPHFRESLTDTLLCAHNASTERRILKTYFPIHDFGPWIDTLKLSRLVFPGLPNYKLETVVRSIGAEARLHSLFPDRDFHDALFDAAASALILEKLFHDFPDMSTEALISPDMLPYVIRRRKL